MADFDGLGAAQLFISPQVSDPNYYQKGILATQDAFSRKRAGALFAQGDYAGAAQALAGSGDVAGAEGLQDRTSRQAGYAAANQGDIAGARQQFAQTGDGATYQAGTAAAQQVAEQKIAGLQAIASNLAKVPMVAGDATNDPNTPRARVLASLAQSGFGSQFGLSPAEIAKAYGGSPGDLADDHLKAVANFQLPFNGTVKKDERVFVNGQQVAEGVREPVKLDSGPGTSQALFSPNGGPALAQTTAGPVVVAPGSGMRNAQGAQVGETQPFKVEPFTYAAGSGVGYSNGVDAPVLPGQASPSPASAATSPASGNGGHNGPGGGQQGPLSADQVWTNMVQRESGGRPGVSGPETPYGVAHGSTQMLDGTAQQMAAKLGVPWRPDLMRGTSPEAAQYQQALGRAYFDEGLAKGKGDPAFAAAYYQGGPNAAIHGPQNAAYVHAVTGSGTGTTGAPQGAPGTQAPQGVQQTTVNGVPVQRDPTGRLSEVPGAFGPAQVLQLSQQVAGNEEVKQAQAAQAAYSALRGNAGHLTGPAAYSILDTFARAINPGAVARAGTIENLKESVGPVNKLVGMLQSYKSQGDLPLNVQQQFLDAVLPFVSAHYDQAASQNARAAQIAKHYGADPTLVQVDIGAKPERYVIGQRGGNNAGGSPPVAPDRALSDARAYIAAHPQSRAQVIGRLRGWGINPAGL